MGGSKSLGVSVLFEFDNFTVADTEGHDPVVVEHATRALDAAAGATGDEDAVTLRHEFAWFEDFDFNATVELLKEVGHGAVALVSARVVGAVARSRLQQVARARSLCFRDRRLRIDPSQLVCFLVCSWWFPLRDLARRSAPAIY